MVMQSQLSTSTKMSRERAQQAIQDQALLEGRIMNAKPPCVSVVRVFGTASGFI
jgi:hypothetical protein